MPWLLPVRARPPGRAARGRREAKPSHTLVGGNRKMLELGCTETRAEDTRSQSRMVHEKRFALPRNVRGHLVGGNVAKVQVRVQANGPRVMCARRRTVRSWSRMFFAAQRIAPLGVERFTPKCFPDAGGPRPFAVQRRPPLKSQFTPVRRQKTIWFSWVLGPQKTIWF